MVVMAMAMSQGHAKGMEVLTASDGGYNTRMLKYTVVCRSPFAFVLCREGGVVCPWEYL